MHIPTKKAALLIGNGKYTDRACLDQASADVAAMQHLLINKFQFEPDELLCLVDQSLFAIDAAFRSLERKAKLAFKNQEVFFFILYYSGHGIFTDLKT